MRKRRLRSRRFELQTGRMIGVKNITILFQTFERHVVKILFRQLIRMEVAVMVEVRMALLRHQHDMKQQRSQDRDINLLQERRINLDINQTTTSLTMTRTEMDTLTSKIILRQVAEDRDQKRDKFR